MSLVIGNQRPFTNYGWECHKCGAVYAPTTSQCFNCKGKVNNGYASPNSYPPLGGLAGYLGVNAVSVQSLPINITSGDSTTSTEDIFTYTSDDTVEEGMRLTTEVQCRCPGWNHNHL